ncbi:MAG: hypothetical protein LQ338_001827 [Usnochroma carphineum]|nr:MAG: hypothetical protein LQ338_001827 [Usnochroma carphineum]
MVTTRSQEHDNGALPTKESREYAATDTAVMSNGRRKKANRSSINARPGSSTKRRKLDGGELGLEETPGILAAVVIPAATNDVATHQVSELGKRGASHDIGMTPETHQLGKRPPSRDQGRHGTSDTGPPHTSEEARPEMPVTLEESAANKHSKPATSTIPTSSPNTKAKQSRRPSTEVTPLNTVSPRSPSTLSEGRRASRHKRLKSNEVISDPPTSLPDDSSLEKLAAPETSLPESRHKRFESEEAASNLPIGPPDEPPAEKLGTHGTTGEPNAQKQPEDSLSGTPATHGIVEDGGGESSSDEAPEIVTQSTGLEKARSAAAEAAKAAEAQRTADKQKRRERDRLLKLQASATKKKQEETDDKDVRHRAPTDDDTEDQAFPAPLDAPNEVEWPTKEPLPALLPDEILAAKPMTRLPTPSPELVPAKAPMNKKRRFLEESTKPPKDVRKGNVRIRVLEDTRAVLPPKVSKDSQGIRESWLAGRLGAKGKVMVERRKIGAGFVRR